MSLRRKKLYVAHENFGHPGIQKLLNLISLVQEGIFRDLTSFTKEIRTY